jgi:hypothetical protein
MAVRCRPGTARDCNGPGSAVHHERQEALALHRVRDTWVDAGCYFFFFGRFVGGGLYTMPSSFIPSGSVK